MKKGLRRRIQRGSSGGERSFSEEVMFGEVILESNIALKTYHPRQESVPWNFLETDISEGLDPLK